MSQFPGLRTIRLKNQSTPAYQADICVVGSGAAGLSAALEAALLGNSVILVDAAPQIGGQAVGSALSTICGLFSNAPVPTRLTHGVMDDMFENILASGDATLRRVRGTYIFNYMVNSWMRWAEDQILSLGITPIPGAIVRAVEKKAGNIEALYITSRFGDATVEANRFIDASGDAVLPWLAGLDLQESDKSVLGSVMAVLENVNTEVCRQYPRSLYHDIIRKHGKEFGLVRSEGPVFVLPKEGSVLLNLTHIETPMEASGLALAGIDGRRQVDSLLKLFKRELPEAYKESRVTLYGGAGIRQSRTIIGQTHVTLDDVINGTQPSDAIARTTWPIEFHGDMAEATWTVFDENHMHYIPFGAMVPVGLDNVVVAGRCIDAVPAALASLRVMGPCFAMGRAAAAAAHLTQNGSFHQIDIPSLQEAIGDNLHKNSVDAWSGKFVEETGPEANGL
jgi:hypothetical protein